MDKKYHLSEKAREAQREYLRQWRKNRRESLTPEEYEKFKEENRTYHRQWRETHKDNIRESRIKYWEKKASDK